MQSDLEEFPDGGRATLVRRYSPALTKKHVDLLASCPYETPRRLIGREYRQGLGMVHLKLLERDPSSEAVFRVTEAGAEVVHRWKSAGFLP